MVTPLAPDARQLGVLDGARYQLRFAASAADLCAVQRLRYAVFNLELGEGLAGSAELGRDEDEYDGACDHLMVIERGSGAVVGTYRMQTLEMAEGGSGLYSASEFDLSALPREVLAGGAEVGRACVAREHRTGRVLHLLWLGLARYLAFHGRRYLFGCCSITSQDRAEGQGLYRELRTASLLDPDCLVRPLPALSCAAAGEAPAPPLPPLFAGYLKLGARVCGEPAIDERFGTIDFFLLLDCARLEPSVHRRFFRDTPWSCA